MSKSIMQTWAVACVAVSTFWIAAGVRALGVQQQSPNSRDMSVTEIKRRFKSSVEDVSKKWHVAIIAESAPIIETSPPVSEISGGQESASDAVKRLAIRYDYSVLYNGAVYLLRKRFTDPRDLPDLTLPEAKSALNAILRILDAGDVFTGNSLNIDTLPQVILAKTLSQEQARAVSGGGLAISDLTEPQQELAWRYALAIQYGKISRTAVDSQHFLGGVSPTGTPLHWGPVDEAAHEFGYDATIGVLGLSGPPQERNILKPLSHPQTVYVASGGEVTIATLQGPDGLVDNSDPTAPTAQSKAFAQSSSGDDAACTLANVIAAVNKRCSDSAAYAVSSNVAQKLITMAGLEFTTPDEGATSAAELYHLLLRRRTKGGGTLDVPAIPIVSGQRAVRNALLDQIPDSVARCLRSRHSLTLTGATVADESAHPWHYDFRSFGQAIATEAKLQVRSVAEPLVDRSPAKRIILDALPAATMEAFTLSQSIESFAALLYGVDRQVPLWVSDFDHASLTGSITAFGGGRADVTLGLSAVDRSTGQLVSSPRQTVTLITPQ